MLIFLIGRVSSSLPCRRRMQLGSLHHNASHIFNSFSSALKLSESNLPNQKLEGNESFAVSYLMNTVGFSPKVAIEVSKKVKLKDPDNPNSVLDIFRRYGLSDTQISKIVKLFPPVLLANPEKTLLPKLRFFQSIGFSSSELPELLSSNSVMLKWSLKQRIIPYYEALKSVCDDVEEANIALKRSKWIFVHQDVTNIVPNIKVLREHGVPQSSVFLLLTKFASAAFMNHAKFVEYVKFAKETGIDPSKPVFIQAITVLAQTKKSTWESKLDIFKRCGWTRDVTLLAFRKNPHCMLLSEEKITSSMKFLVDEIGLPLEDIARSSSLLGYSLRQRIIPRCSVIKALKMKGLIEKDMSFVSILGYSEKKFLEKFVFRFQESVPQLLNIYKGPLGPLPEVQ